MDDDAVDVVVGAVGGRLRGLRRERGTTLAQLARDTGISVSTLSRLESGQRRATLELLLPLARAYQVPLDELVGAPETGDPRIHARPIRRHGMTMVPLTRRPGGLQAYKMSLDGAAEAAFVLMRPVLDVTEEVLDRAFRLKVRGLGANDRNAGEVAEFDTRTPHWFGNPGPGPAEVLGLFGPQGERLHVRARPTRG